MAIFKRPVTLDHKPKCTSQGAGRRSRRTKIAMSTMNKRKKTNHKNYRGQGR